MPTIYYYGKKTNFIGKTLYEILANLRNFGVNRMLLKQEELLQNPGKKCYYIVKKAEPVLDDELQEGAIYAERVYRGARVPGLVFVDEESWHTDWQLVPKSKEDLYRLKPEEYIEHGHPSTITVLPRWMEIPPLMDIFLRRNIAAKRGVTTTPVQMDSDRLKIMMHYQLDKISKPHEFFRVAEEGEEGDFLLNKPIEKVLSGQFRPENQKQKK